jgi:tetratricopeptide (TPR) repeat protein
VGDDALRGEPARPAAMVRWDRNRRIWMFVPGRRAGTANVVKAVIYGGAIVTGGLLADFAVNVITGGTLPGPLDRYRTFAWPTMIAMFALSLGAAVRERLGRRDPAAAPPPEAAPEAAAGYSNLPPVSGEFTGRQADLERLRALVPPAERDLPAAPVVATICGLAGVGKSTLAVRFAHEMRRRFPDAQLYVDLQGFDAEPLDPVDALSRLVRALGVRGRDLPMDREGLTSLYRERLQGRRAIVVLDHAADEAQVKALLPGVPTCLVLITSLQPLDQLISSSQLRLGVMSEAEAIDLLARIAGDHVRSPEHIEATMRVATLCGYLPLALSIAGVLLRRHGRRSVAELELELTGKRNVLEKFQLGGLDVRVGFDVSYEHLEERERTLFRRLSLLPEPTFGADVAAALLDCPVGEAERLLDGLVDEQVLERLGGHQFMLQNLLGVYAGERLLEEPQHEQQAARERALRRSLAEATRYAALLDPAIAELAEDDAPPAGGSLDDQLGALDWFERERPRLLKVARLAADAQAHDVVWRLAAILVPFFDLRGHRADWTEVQEAAMRSVDAGGRLLARAWTELGTGRLRWLERDHRAALAHFEEALETAMAGRWPRLEARARYLIGRIAHDMGSLDEAVSRYSRAATMFAREAMARDQASALLYTTGALHERGLLDSAEVLRTGDAVLAALAEMPEDLWVVRTTGRVMDYVGMVADQLGDHEHAGTCSIASAEAFRRIGFRYGYGQARRRLGAIRLGQGNVSRALAFLDESVVLFRTIGDRRAEGLSLLLLGDAHRAAGAEVEAGRCWRDALAALVESGSAEAEGARARLDSLLA